MGYRRAATLFLIGNESIFSLWRDGFQEQLNISRRTVRIYNHSDRNTRAFHTATPLRVDRLLSVEELFARRSLQEYLKKIEMDYSQSLREINSSAMEEQFSNDKLRNKRTSVAVLTPLFQAIRDLDNKIKESQETEVLLKGKTVVLLPHKDNTCSVRFCLIEPQTIVKLFSLQ